ncbi:hypothetical protein EDC96DRAFT_548778 [Choanephora cucurbitarum]|nr:hypothetical protein EDC96DRAFT_548778 [Choanephora cucurbitarum]
MATRRDIRGLLMMRTLSKKLSVSLTSTSENCEAIMLFQEQGDTLCSLQSLFITFITKTSSIDLTRKVGVVLYALVSGIYFLDIFHFSFTTIPIDIPLADKPSMTRATSKYRLFSCEQRQLFVRACFLKQFQHVIPVNNTTRDNAVESLINWYGRCIESFIADKELRRFLSYLNTQSIQSSRETDGIQ